MTPLITTPRYAYRSKTSGLRQAASGPTVWHWRIPDTGFRFEDAEDSWTGRPGSNEGRNTSYAVTNARDPMEWFTP
ncbi:hypothetical protein [Methanosphaerula subterraneus]|uniref:hypothetical protein n=1 Tax=Methanosphaerula subterraneus TaxID=3350244 RepID=UPI003F8714B7